MHSIMIHDQPTRVMHPQNAVGPVDRGRAEEKCIGSQATAHVGISLCHFHITQTFCVGGPSWLVIAKAIPPA